MPPIIFGTGNVDLGQRRRGERCFRSPLHGEEHCKHRQGVIYIVPVGSTPSSVRAVSQFLQERESFLLLDTTRLLLVAGHSPSRNSKIAALVSSGNSCCTQ